MKKQSVRLITTLGVSALLTPSLLTARPASRVGPVAEATYTATIGPSLKNKLNALANVTDVVTGTTIVTFNTASGLTGVTDLSNLLTRNGILTVGHRFESLGMISVANLTKAQVTSLAAEPSVRSLWANDQLSYSMHQARVLCGVDKLRGDAAMTARVGHVIDGTPSGGQFSVAVIDSGIDTRNTDLPFDVTTSTAGGVPTSKVIQNVLVVGDSGVATLTTVPNQVNTDSVNHGTHCSGIVGGSGAYSRTVPSATYPTAGQTEDFSGVAGRFTGTALTDASTAASGVKIVGLGSGAVLFILDAMGGFEYVLNNQAKYNIKVTSNSYGSSGTYDPADPLNVAIKNAYNAGIVNVFAAGNSGPGVDTIGPNSKSPYAICVAAGTKEGGLASFSSRGLPLSQRTPTGEVAGSQEFNLPAITAPGTGREFEFDGPYDPAGTSPFISGTSAPNPDTVGKKFYSDMIATRSITGTAAVGMNDQEFPAPYIANYTMISGTSMATPFVSGTCALLFSVNPSLTPAQIKTILQKTATRMPDYQDYEVGAGYLNAYAAVDLALNPNKPYYPFNRIDAPYSSSYSPFITNINAQFLAATGRPTSYPPTTVTQGSAANKDEDFSLAYGTQSVAAADYAAAKTKAKTNDNAYAFLVDADTSGNPTSPAAPTTILDARIQFGNSGAAGLAGGNSIGMLLWAPDGTSYSSGISLPVLDSPTRQVVVRNPKPGLWVAEFRGLRGLAAVPVTPPTGAGLPDTVTGQIYRTSQLITNPPTDINGIPQSDSITFALLNRYLDQNSSGLFKPQTSVTRGDFVQVLADNMPMRQSLASTNSPYTDTTSAVQARYAEAAAQYGSTLRDWDFTPGPTLPTNSATFTPNSLISRMQAAVAMVRALGLDAEAQNLAYTTVSITNADGTITTVSDARLVAPEDRGYLQLALNRGLISYFADFQGRVLANPTKSLTRADLATAIVNFRTIFRTGNSLAVTERIPQ